MSRAKILIVEDESIVAMEIEELLEEDYEIVAICSNADEAYSVAISREIDLILMDISLENGSCGIEASRRVKEIKIDMPIIFLTAFMDDETIDRAIEVNPVAYITKPFHHIELFTAIKIALRQRKESYNFPKGAIKIDSEFSFNTNRSELLYCEEPIHLTKKERDLLQLFLDKPNQLISNELIEHIVWQDKFVNDNARRVLMSRLRAKLKHKFIETYSMEGYIFRK